MLVAGRQGVFEVVCAHQAVVGQGELAGDLFALLHGGQADAHGLEQHDGGGHHGLVGGLQHDVVFVADGGLGDAEFDADELVVEEDAFVGGQARVHGDAARCVQVVGGAGAPAVVAGRDGGVFGDAGLVAVDAADVGGEGFVLQDDAGIGQACDGLALGVEGAGVDVDQLEAYAALAVSCDGDGDGDAAAGVVVCRYLELQLVVAVGDVGAGAGVDLDEGALADVQGPDGAAAGQAHPGGWGGAFAGLQLDLHALGGAVAFVGEGEFAAGALGLLDTDFQGGGLGGEAGARFV